ncbi:MAG: sigma-70 family RNA polymerase sigma factor [Flavobacteriaceae bacterium]|nr:sigma-70 family RNA polymerase sigma factor [Flavobacteriaceae bacterium]
MKKNDLSFDNLLSTNWDYVYNFLMKKCNDDFLSEEITIKSFSKAFEKIHLFNEQYKFKTWIVSIAKNQLNDYLKKKKIRFENIENIKSESFKNNFNPEEELINKERYNYVNEKIDELKPMYKEIIKLKYIEDLSINQISQKLNQPVNTIKIKIYRAKRILNQILDLE